MIFAGVIAICHMELSHKGRTALVKLTMTPKPSRQGGAKAAPCVVWC